MKEKTPTIQIRPSVNVETAMILEILAKKHQTFMGKVLEDLLNESETFKQTKEKIYKVI